MTASPSSPSPRDRVDVAGEFLLALETLEACPEFAALIPEVRANLAYASATAQSPADVMAVEGRITVIEGRPRAAGRPRFGTSSHMARLLLELRRYDPAVRAGLNFACTPELVSWLEAYSRDRGWVMSAIHREHEPEAIRAPEGASMPWKIQTAVANAGGQVPTLFYERGGVGKEDLTVLVGPDVQTVVTQVCDLARAYTLAQRSPAKIGKIDLAVFQDFLQARLGHPDPSVRVPPLTGVDAGVIDIDHGQVLLVAEDPIFWIPSQPPEMFGWFTVHIGASDIAVMGVKPRYLTYSLLMPPETPDDTFRAIVEGIHRAAADLEIAIVGGHTGYYPGLSAPTIGGVTVFAIAPKDSYVTPAGAHPGNAVILTKGPAIEATGLLASLRAAELRDRYAANWVQQAQDLCHQITVVRDAEIAMATGGVTAMHDATEGGVLGGLFEMAAASGVGMDIDAAAMVWPETVQAVCEAFGIDPLAAIAEGTLLITAEADQAAPMVAALQAEGIAASVIGTVTADPETRQIRRRDGTIAPLAIPTQDPFWPAFFAGVARQS